MKTPKLAFRSWAIFPLLLVALGVCSIAIVVLMTRHARHAMQDAFSDTHMMLLAHVQDRAHILVQANDSTFNIARVVGAPPNENLYSYSAIESKVAPRLFTAFSMISWVSQVSYLGLDGLILSYYHEGDQTRIMFSNTTHTPNDSGTYQWYSQLVNANSGEQYDNVTIMDPLQSTEFKWFYDALNGKSGYASWGFGWGKSREPMLFFTAPIAKKGLISLGILVKEFKDYVSSIDLHGGQLYFATKDGHFLSHIEPPHANYVLSNEKITLHVTDQNDILQELFNVTCQIDNHMDTTTRPLIFESLSIWGKRYESTCAPFDVAGLQLVSVMIFPSNSLMPLLQKMKVIVVSLLSLIFLGLIVGSYIVLQVIRGLQVQATFLRVDLIKQKEAIQQAERKSMNKSLAFASASHDVRTSLAGITGLIELCHGDVPPNSELDRNLVQMSICASKLLGILNSVLDTSKVEAGKMQLEEVEFDMAQVLEESIDIFHVVALKKGLEVIWDPCDCSVLKSLNVKGDCRRLKQILDNLLGNAVKFTSEGHVVVRAWCKKPSLENFKLSREYGCHFLKLYGHMSRFLWRGEDAYTDSKSLNHTHHDPNSIEFVFEVDDTGMGIPKEKRAFVFENYVQVKELTPEGHEGTGLGLGIVQSFVRLMGGEINIQDKEPGERGTCFRFNFFLKSNEISSTSAEGDTNPHSVQASNQLYMQDPSTSNVELTNLRAMAFRKGLKLEDIHSLLFIQGDATRRIAQRWMMSLGIKVWKIHHWEHLSPALEEFKHDLIVSGKYDMEPPSVILSRTTSQNSNSKKEGLASSNETGQNLPLTNKDISKKSIKGSLAYLLIIIDLSCGDFSAISSVLKNFVKDIHNIQYKVVWLANSNIPSGDMRRIKEAPCDLILQKPFHASRLYAVLRLLQDFGGANDGHLSDMVIENTLQGTQQTTGPSSPTEKALFNSSSLQSSNIAHERNAFSCNENDGKPLSGMNILLVEDTRVLRHLASTRLSRLGATVESSENGLEALNLVKKALREAIHVQDGSAKKQEVLGKFPYNVILMDCEMPIMDGYEATRHIRAEEIHYGHHIPIIALTAHATPEEEKKTILAGMDFHLTKPLQTNKLLEAICNTCQN